MYKIVNAECLADKIYLMDVEAPRVARACQPGEFVIVKMDEVGERIPLTICDFDREKGLVTIVFQIVGASTMRMAELKAGDYFQDFVGPLGQPSEFVKEDLEEVKTKFGDERLTKIKPAEGDIEEEDLIKEEQTIVALTHFGYIKRMPADTYKSQRRGGKGITGISTRADDFVTEIFTASTHDTILFFSNKGKLYRLRGYEIPEAGRTAKGTAIVNLLSLDPGEKITAVIPISNFAEGKYLLMATQKGFIKKTALTEYNSARKTGLQAITLKEEDELIAVRLTDGQDNVVLVTEDGMSITFSEQDVRPMGRTAQGVIGIKLGDGDKVIGMESIIDGANATLLAITEHGFGKRTDLDEYRVQNRGGRGVITYKVTQKTGKLVGIRVTDDSNDIMMITDTGTIIRISVKDVSVLGRSTQGVTLMRTNDGGKVVSIELVEPEETNEE